MTCDDEGVGHDPLRHEEILRRCLWEGIKRNERRLGDGFWRDDDGWRMELSRAVEDERRRLEGVSNDVSSVSDGEETTKKDERMTKRTSGGVLSLTEGEEWLSSSEAWLSKGMVESDDDGKGERRRRRDDVRGKHPF